MWRPLKKIAEGAEKHSGRILPEGLSAVKAALGKVYCHQGEYFEGVTVLYFLTIKNKFI